MKHRHLLLPLTNTIEMTVRLEFEAEKHILEPEHDGLALEFPFCVVTPGTGALADTKSQPYTVIAEASANILLEWGFEFPEDPFAPAPTFFEYARPEAIRSTVEDELTNTERISIRRPQGVDVMPQFDPAKLKEPKGHCEIIDLDYERMLLRETRGEGRIGFVIPSQND